jgi:hypothetical protein
MFDVQFVLYASYPFFSDNLTKWIPWSLEIVTEPARHCCDGRTLPDLLWVTPFGIASANSACLQWPSASCVPDSRNTERSHSVARRRGATLHRICQLHWLVCVTFACTSQLQCPWLNRKNLLTCNNWVLMGCEVRAAAEATWDRRV